MELAEIFYSQFGPIPANLWLFDIQKNLGFSVFLGKFGNFFFQNAIWSKIVPRTIKNGF